MRIKTFARLALILVVVSVSSPLLHPSEPQAEAAIEVGEISFDGKEYTYSGPTELEVGEYSFVFKDQSELFNVKMALNRFSDGKTLQDFLGIQGEPGEYFPKPDWVKYAPELGSAQIRTDGGEVHTYILNKAGEYAIHILIPPSNIWIISTPIYVKEAPAE